MPVLTPDIDNIIKIILDGLNGAAYQDDKQVVAVVARKRYDNTGHVTVMVEGMPK
jgi:Holliday junction resolvase RusA-like endonuclease